MLPEVGGCGLRDFAYSITYIYADLCHCPWLVPFRFHMEFSYQPRLNIYCGVSLFSDFRYNHYLTRDAATVVKRKSRIPGCWLTRMGKTFYPRPQFAPFLISATYASYCITFLLLLLSSFIQTLEMFSYLRSS
jgi:hypothetical protein